MSTNETPVVDLATLDSVGACNQGSEIELKHPVTNAPLGVFVGILGKDSDAFRDHVRFSVNEDFRRAQLAKKRGKPEEAQTMEKNEARGVELLIACTTGWRTGKEPTLKIGSEQLQFNVANAKRVYENYPWIKAQVDEGIVDLENFMKG